MVQRKRDREEKRGKKNKEKRKEIRKCGKRREEQTIQET